jgi:hypothetical protein
MPSVSKKQHNLMAAVAHNPAFAKKVGIPQSVGKDFATADKGKTFKKGGIMKESMGPRNMSQDVEKGSNMKRPHGESAVQKRGHTKGRELGVTGKKSGIQGGAMGGKGTFGAAPIKMAKGGTASSRADGIAMKGKTKGKMC